uniref:Ig-like domain-containing protein n=1 Tax=Gasterosteus aculeatus aculeatus TaxID=481459 RepID=A0AAQ4PHC1_GASAC
MSPSAGGLVVFLLSVQGLQVQVRRSASTWLELTCHSSCVLSDRPEYVWYKNEENIKRGSSLPVSSGSTDRYSCNLRGSYSHGSPAVYGPQRPSVSVSPSAEMLEGGSVTLTCSADANPAASYTWYKQDGTSDPRLLSEEPQLVFSSIQSSDSGNYSCTAENQLGRKTSEFISIDVKYGPQRPSVSVSPSAEMLEGDSVTLTCSTDANPAANYTWYKEHEDSPRASGQIFTITDFTAEHSGNYYCEAQNEMGRSNSTLLRITSSEKGGSSWSKTTAVAFTSVILLVIIILAAFLLIRKRSRPAERPDNNEIPPAEPCYATVSFSRNQEDLLLYSNVSPARPHRRKEEVEEVLYSGVNFESSGAASERRCEGAVDDSSALYSTVSKAPRE